MNMPDGSPQRLCAPGCRRGCSYHLTRTACADFRLARLSTTCGTIPPNAFEKFQNLFLAKSASFDVQRQLGHSPSAHGLHLRYDYLRELQALKALRELQLRLKSNGQQFESRLRSHWRIEQVEHKGAYYDESGNLHAAADLHVTLSSGTRVQGVRVAFTSQAGHDLKRMTGTSDRDYETQRRQKIDTTRSFIRLLLAAGGDFAWDPLWNDHLTIDSATLA